ncbi:MAG: hypothetical protein JXJ20_10090 [Anaerolineae bacterium]|nr:hypothetical protein [Anaerolineae bacterium]
MADLQALFATVDQLPPDDLEQLHHYIEQRRRATWGVVPPDRLSQIDKALRPVQAEAAAMSDEEINAAIREASKHAKTRSENPETPHDHTAARQR